MARFDRQIATAIRLIHKNGEIVQWRTVVDGTPPDPAKPWNPAAPTPVDNNVAICFLPVDRLTMETFSFKKGTEVPKGALMGLMGQVNFEPNLKDVVLRGGETLRIANIDVLSPNGQKILYTVLFES